MPERRSASSGTAYEARNRYARAVRVGPHIWTAGTLAVDAQGDVFHPESPYQQTIYALEKLERALAELGASRADVVRTRIYIVRSVHADDIGSAHADFFGDIFPCCTLVEIKGLAHPQALVEVELEAYVSGGGG